MSYEENLCLPAKVSEPNSPTSQKSFDVILNKNPSADNHSYNPGNSDRTSFMSKQEKTSFEKLGEEQPRHQNSRSMLNSASGDHTEAIMATESINCTRICNYREVRALFDEHAEIDHDRLHFDSNDKLIIEEEE